MVHKCRTSATRGRCTCQSSREIRHRLYTRNVLATYLQAVEYSRVITSVHVCVWTSWKFCSVMLLSSRCRMLLSVWTYSRSTSSRSSSVSGMQHSCFHTIGARCRSRGFLVRMATPIRMPRNLNCSKCSSRHAEGFSRNLKLHTHTQMSFQQALIK